METQKLHSKQKHTTYIKTLSTDKYENAKCITPSEWIDHWNISDKRADHLTSDIGSTYET
jgi:hypothetical protein